MADLESPAEMPALMAELEELLRHQTVLIVKLNAVSSIQEELMASLEAINRRQVEIISRVHMLTWISDARRPAAPVATETFRQPETV